MPFNSKTIFSFSKIELGKKWSFEVEINNEIKYDLNSESTKIEFVEFPKSSFFSNPSPYSSSSLSDHNKVFNLNTGKLYLKNDEEKENKKKM